MPETFPNPIPLFDTLKNLSAIPESIYHYVRSLNIALAEQEFTLCLEFLKKYSHSNDTFTAYRREVERLLLWAWLIYKKPLKTISANEIELYLTFVNAPPQAWIAIKNVNRFIINSEGQRLFNAEWRPFVLRLSKIQRLQAQKPDKSLYQLASKSITAVIATLGSLFNFLQHTDYLVTNPIHFIRQQKSSHQRQQKHFIPKKLNHEQWLKIIKTAERMSQENSAHQRTLFLIWAFYLLGLRISELSHTPEYNVNMRNFVVDQNGMWWYQCEKKNSKVCPIAVPQALLERLKNYRLNLGLAPLPHPEEDTPLLPKMKGRQGLGSRQIRNLVQSVFNNTIDELLRENKKQEAEELAIATVHWLRPTSPSVGENILPSESDGAFYE